MKKKLSLLIVCILIPLNMYSQIGINNTSPKATLDVTSGTTGNSTTVAEGIIAPRLTISDLNMKTPAYGADQIGALVYVTNFTNGTASGQTQNINSAGYYYFDGSFWQRSSGQIVSAVNNLDIYGGQATIPPHKNFVADWTNHTVSTYDTADWQIISKTSTPGSSSGTLLTSITLTAPSMMVVYEYQGTPFNLTNLYPMLTAGNQSNYPDTFVANFISVSNTGTGGKTRLAVNITRTDIFGGGSSSSTWAGTFLLNILLARKNF